MEFEAILPAFKRGRKIRRAVWPKWFYLQFKSGKVTDQNDDSVNSFSFSGAMEGDWEFFIDELTHLRTLQSAINFIYLPVAGLDAAKEFLANRIQELTR